MTTIDERLQAVRARIQAAAIDAGRSPDCINLLAVGKAHPAAAIRAAYIAGQHLFGENYVQEALSKQTELAELAIEWHFIGPIQSNKTQMIAEHFAWVHGVDRLKIAERLNMARPQHMPALQVCIQVNVSGETSKSGVSTAEVFDLAAQIVKLPHLKLRGLMAIPAPTTEVELQRKQFRMVRELYEAMIQQGYALDTLSIGMSEDFPIAIAEGATIVRVGSAIFGPRPTSE